MFRKTGCDAVDFSYTTRRPQNGSAIDLTLFFFDAHDTEVTDSERSLRMQLGVELTGAENSCRVRSVADRESAVMSCSRRLSVTST